MTYNSRRMFKNPYRFTTGEKSLHEMRTNKPGATCYQVHFKVPFGSDAAR